MKKDKTVYIVHCVDTEGPLVESLEATFERLKDLFGIRLTPSLENLQKIQRQALDFGKLTPIIAEVFSKASLNYNRSWDDIEDMLKQILSPNFRNQLTDSFGRGWIYNWFCVDHVDYLHNPRQRELGYHKIHDFYKDRLKKYDSKLDGLHWHFHPMSTYKEAHRCATSYVNSPQLYQILCRRIIERTFFPVAVRAGFQAERPDSHLFFEQWIPFDFTNWAYRDNTTLDAQNDLKGGRSGDWRLAPDDWSIYHPSVDYWHLPGNCRRWIARSLDICVRGREFTQMEVDKAFARAQSGLPTLMACNNHDFRNMVIEVNMMRKKIDVAAHKFPDVQFKFCEAVEAFRHIAFASGKENEPLKLDVKLERRPNHFFLQVETLHGKVFGPQPFLAVKTKSGRFIHDNFDFDTSLTKWFYTFDQDSIRHDDVEQIGVAANDIYGHSVVEVL